MLLGHFTTLIGFGGGMSRGLSSTSSATAGQYNTTSSKTDGFNVITWGLDSRATSYDSGSFAHLRSV